MQVAATALLNLALALLLGTSMAQLWLRNRASPWAAAQLPVLRKLAIGALAAAMLADTMILALEAASMADVPVAQAGPAIGAALGATHYGLAWQLGMGALLAVALTAVVRWSPRLAMTMAMARLAALGVFFYSRSIVSHAGASGDMTWAVAAD